jgi:hypothetical protein
MGYMGNKVNISNLSICPNCGNKTPSKSCPSKCCCQNKDKVIIYPHTHKFFGFTDYTDKCKHRHNHYFSGRSSQVIPKSSSHVHAIYVDINSSNNHQHCIGQKSESDISIGKGKHIHIIKGITTLNENHVHDFIFTTLIENPHMDS